MKHKAHQTSYRNNSGFKNMVSTVVAVPITYDEQKKIYKFKEKKQVPGISQENGISSKQLRYTCKKISIAVQAVSLGGAILSSRLIISSRFVENKMWGIMLIKLVLDVLRFN